jgi:lipopolysaccharide biosynthesis protein
VMSSETKMHVGVIGCRELVPQPWKLTEKFPEELDALYAAVKPAKKAPAKKTPAKKPAAKKAAAKKPAKRAARRNPADIG